jgi:hypothetical protein
MNNTITEVKTGSFIFAKNNALASDICREIIDRFERSEADQYPGRVGQQAEQQSSIKQSTDLVVSNNPAWADIDRELFRSLSQAMAEFSDEFDYFKGPFKDIGYAIQRTRAGEFYHWHIDGGSHDFAQRQLVAIWYLNGVPGDGGKTEFRYQQVEVTPEPGKLLLFPPFWTHLHRGQVLDQGVKYIATSWVVFA